MKHMDWALIAIGVFLFALPAQAVEKKKAVPAATETKSAAAEAEVKAAPAVVSKEELTQRSLTGIQNQTAWIATLQKQLDGEKAKLTQMEGEHAKLYGGTPSKKVAEKESSTEAYS